MKYILLIAIVCSLYSCSKTETAASGDKTKPVLTIIAPVGTQVYQTGDPLCFKGNVIDDLALSSVKLKLFKSGNMNRAVVEYNYPLSGRSLQVEEKTYIPAELNGDCILQFEATDHNNNRAVATYNFSGN